MECGRGPESKFYYFNTNGRITLSSEVFDFCFLLYFNNMHIIVIKCDKHITLIFC